jgi:hypothetical protein
MIDVVGGQSTAAAGGASVPASRLVRSLAPPNQSGAHGVTRPTFLPSAIGAAYL